MSGWQFAGLRGIALDESLTPLVPLDTYEQHAVHIGTNQKSSDMKASPDVIHKLRLRGYYQMLIWIPKKYTPQHSGRKDALWIQSCW